MMDCQNQAIQICLISQDFLQKTKISQNIVFLTFFSQERRNKNSKNKMRINKGIIRRLRAILI